MYILFTHYIYDAFVHQNWKVHWAFMSLLGLWNVWTTRGRPLAGNRFVRGVLSPKNDHASHAENRSSCSKSLEERSIKPTVVYTCVLSEVGIMVKTPESPLWLVPTALMEEGLKGNPVTSSGLPFEHIWNDFLNAAPVTLHESMYK